MPDELNLYNILFNFFLFYKYLNFFLFCNFFGGSMSTIKIVVVVASKLACVENLSFSEWCVDNFRQVVWIFGN